MARYSRSVMKAVGQAKTSLTETPTDECMHVKQGSDEPQNRQDACTHDSQHTYIVIPTHAVAVAHRQLMSYHQHCIMKPDITTSQKAMMA
jgi:hypothetical protein